jgi:hypothetical protein
VPDLLGPRHAYRHADGDVPAQEARREAPLVAESGEEALRAGLADGEHRDVAVEGEIEGVRIADANLDGIGPVCEAARLHAGVPDVDRPEGGCHQRL